MLKKCKFVSHYLSLSQTSESFEKCTGTLELTLDTLTKSN